MRINISEKDLDFLIGLTRQFVKKREKSLEKLSPDHPVKPRVVGSLTFAKLLLATLEGAQKKDPPGEGGPGGPAKEGGGS